MTENYKERILRSGLRAAAVGGPAGLLAAPAAQRSKKKHAGRWCSRGRAISIVGGKIDPAGEGQPIVGHMYVEYMIPQRLRPPYPIVMVHGGSQTGTNFTGTPDGREGWAQYFVRRGYAVYVVDQVARGRSAHWNDVHGPVQPSRLNRSRQRFVAPERYTMWPQAQLHTQWPGAGKPGDAALRPVLCLAGGLDRELHQAAGDQSAGDHRAAREDRPVDPADAFAVRRLRLAGRRPAARPGEGDRRGRAERPAGARVLMSARPTGSGTAARDKPSGLGEVPLTTTRRSARGAKLEFVRQEKADRPGHGALLAAEGAGAQAPESRQDAGR